jgi:hypothetical protein
VRATDEALELDLAEDVRAGLPAGLAGEFTLRAAFSDAGTDQRVEAAPASFRVRSGPPARLRLAACEPVASALLASNDNSGTALLVAEMEAVHEDALGNVVGGRAWGMAVCSFEPPLPPCPFRTASDRVGRQPLPLQN